MMRLFILFLILFLSVWLGLHIHNHPGNVLITYNSWSLETSVWFGLFAIVALYVAINILWQIFAGLFGVFGRLRLWSGQRRAINAQKLTDRGLCFLAEGDFKRAKKTLANVAADSKTPLINYLSAAKAAHELGEFDERDRYLREAHESAPISKIAIGLTQAQLQLDGEQLEQALATLNHLYELNSKHPYILKLLMKVYIKLDDWDKLKTIYPKLKKHHILKPDEEIELDKTLYHHALTQSAKNRNQLIKFWDQLPAAMHQDPKFVLEYCHHLHNCAADDIAGLHIKQCLNKQWDISLVNYFAGLTLSHPEKQLATAEAWLKDHPNDATLLRCLGQLSINNKLWGPAENYLNKSIQLKPLAQSYYWLATVYENEGDAERAAECYKKGLSLTHKKVP